MTRRTVPNPRLTRPAKTIAGQLVRPETSSPSPGLPAPFPYFGGKQRIAASIIELLPPHELYLESYFGSGSLLLAKPPSGIEIVNDLDDSLITFWRVLREQPGELERVCRLTPHSRQELTLARQPLNDDGTAATRIEIARRVFVQLTQGRGGTLASNTGWRTYRAGYSMAKVLQGYVDRLAPIATRLVEVSIEHKDAIDLIADYGNNPAALIVADPPYPFNCRSQNHSGRRYAQEVDDNHHQRLAAALNTIEGKAIIFTYPNPAYDALYASWNRIELAATKQSGETAIEVAYLNYDPPAEPTLLDFIGGDGL